MRAGGARHWRLICWLMGVTEEKSLCSCRGFCLGSRFSHTQPYRYLKLPKGPYGIDAIAGPKRLQAPLAKANSTEVPETLQQKS